MSTYGTLLTNVGERLIAQYLQAGGKLDITDFAVGDGGGAEYKPTQDMIALRGEKWRGPIDAISISDSSHNVIVIEAMVPAEVGGFTIREAGVFDARGNLIGIMNTPQTEKVASGKGISTERHMQIYLAVSSTAVFDLTVDPALAASKEELRQHNEDAYAHLGMLAKIDGKADAADVPTLVELDGKLEEHNKDGQAHGDIRTALAGKASIVLANDAAGVTPAVNQHIWVRTEVADLQGDLSAERLELDQRTKALEDGLGNYLNLHTGSEMNIPSGTDLNTMVISGIYRSASAAVSATLLNSPITSPGFKLEVMALQTPARVRQTIYVQPNTVYSRGCTSDNGAAWTNWMPNSLSGTWTPELMDADGNSDATYSIQYGSWERVGPLVNITVRLTTTTKGSLSGTLAIPIPAELTASRSPAMFPTGACRYVGVTLPENMTHIIAVITGSNNIRLDCYGLANPKALTGESLRDNIQLSFNIAYRGV